MHREVGNMTGQPLLPIQKAQLSLERSLSRRFSAASGLVSGTGIGVTDAGAPCLQVFLGRTPTAAERAALPDTHEHVPARYQVLGPITPQR
jgi:hypothetical protein